MSKMSAYLPVLSFRWGLETSHLQGRPGRVLVTYNPPGKYSVVGGICVHAPVASDLVRLSLSLACFTQGCVVGRHKEHRRGSFSFGQKSYHPVSVTKLTSSCDLLVLVNQGEPTKTSPILTRVSPCAQFLPRQGPAWSFACAHSDNP